MLAWLTVPTLTLLLGFPGLPWLPHFSLRHPKPPAADSLPPPWKSASRLGVESQLVRLQMDPMSSQPVGMQVLTDPRKLRVAVDPDSGTIMRVSEVNQTAVAPGYRMSLGAYGAESSRETFRRLWTQRSLQSLNTLPASTGTTPRTGLSFQFPSPLPPKIQSLLGPGGPALNVSGSENIKLSGTSNWSNQQTGLYGLRRSLFPALDMQQDLNIRLEGQLSDRIRVNLLQNSANPIPLSNRIAINYKGDEDDLVQALDLGNTNLTLPGTQYVSYSGRNEGLFGAKTSLRYGALDFTTLASRQEGRSERASYAGGASKQSRTIYDMDYIKGVYYLLYDPNGLTQSIDEASIRVFKDDYNYGNLGNKVRGRALVDPRVLNNPSRTDTSSVRGAFALLNPGADRDYDILNDVYGPLFKVIRLHAPIAGDQTLAVTYRYNFLGPDGQPAAPTFDMGGQDSDTSFFRPMKLLRAPVRVLKPDSLDPTVFSADTVYAPFNQVRALELKNFYDLSGQNIDPLTLKLSISLGTSDPPLVNVNLADGTPVPYLEVLGLDNLNETTGTPVPGHDGKLDGTIAFTNTRLFVDYVSGTLFFPDPRPFAPRLDAATGSPFERAVDARLNRRARLDGKGTAPGQNDPNPNVYDRYNPQRSTDSRYFINVDFTAQRAGGDVYLGRSNIVDGSDVVTINGQTLTRDRDYTIDYELGRVTLKRQLGPADNLNIDYAYAPLFAQAGRTLVGSAFTLAGRERSLGGAFLYESRGAQDLRPRLGEEPSRSVIGDLNSRWDMKPQWLTHFVDRLPGVRTTAPSELHFQGEAGMSFPNPNTKNEVFVDDMESVRDAVTLAMDQTRWRWSSVPSLRDTITGRARPVTETGIVDTLKDAEIHWYNPLRSIQDRDLKPNLSSAQGGLNYPQVLAISLPRRPTAAAPSDKLWAGLTYPLDPAGLDVSRSQFIELWVNDWNDRARTRDTHVRLHIDLGTVSEDQMRAPDEPPNGLLDTEDQQPRDNQLTVTDKKDEDTGYDGVKDAGENHPVRDLTTAGPADPEGDDYNTFDETYQDLDPRRYRYTNGTEGNKQRNPTPDTEDLNLNQILDTQEDYLEYTIDLGDTTYVVTDVQRESQLGHFPPVASDNGWRRYRIPLNDVRAVKFGNPNLTLARQVRVWLQGVNDVDPLPVGETKPGQVLVKPYLVIASIDIVGSRWQSTTLTQGEANRGTTLTLNSVNNLDNADVYRSPFDPGQTLNGNQEVTRREQSLAVEFTRLAPGDTLEAFKTFSIDEDYSRYGTLRWFATGFDMPEHVPGDSLRYFVRFATDEIGRNYYEVNTPVPPSSSPGNPGALQWQEMLLKLTDISGLKLRVDYHDNDTVAYHYAVPGTQTEYVIKGRPSFTRLRRISVGLMNAHTDSTHVFSRGALWFDEIRATDIAKDVDKAGRLSFSGQVANLGRFNLALDGRGADFLTVGQSRGSGSAVRSVSFSSGLDVHRFFEGTGIVMPATFSYSDNSSKPRFTAGDDIVREGIQADASETRSIARSWSLAYSRVWSERSNALLRYTLGGITANLSQSTGSNTSPNQLGTSRSLGAAVNYNIAPRRLLAFGVPLTKFTLFPLPERAWWNYSLGTTHNETTERLRDGSLGRQLAGADGRTAAIDFGADTRPLDFIHHHIEGHRNLTLPDNQMEKFGFINLGRVTSWRQSADANFSVNRGLWMRPNFGWNSSYGQNNGPEISTDLSLRAVSNNQSLRMNWDFPFERLVPPGPAVVDSTHRAAGPSLWRNVVGRLGTISADAKFDQSSSYSRVAGVPSFVYLLGFSSDPGTTPDGTGRVQTQFGNTTAKNESWSSGVRTRVKLVYGANVNVRGDFNARHGLLNGVITRQASTHFPSLEFDYGQLAHVVLLDRFLRNPQIRTSYDRSRVTDFLLNSTAPSAISTSSEWRPLLGLNGELKNGTRTDLQVERRITQDENHALGNSVKTTRNTNLKFSLSRAYSQGQKVNFLGKETMVRSSVSLGLTANYSRNSGETRILDASSGATGVQSEFLDDRLNVNGTGSYGFSTNVTGNALVGFGQDRDLKLGTYRRNIVVELRASFTF